jgi:hypothetical protein
MKDFLCKLDTALKDAQEYRLQIERFIKEVLEHGIQEFRAGFELIGYESSRVITGYFINPVDLAYVHIWEVAVDLGKRIVYTDTWEEIGLFPAETYKFGQDFIPTEKYSTLWEKGIIDPAFLYRLEDAEWRCLWAIKERLKEHKDAVTRIAHTEPGQEICRVYMETLKDLEDGLGGH